MKTILTLLLSLLTVAPLVAQSTHEALAHDLYVTRLTVGPPLGAEWRYPQYGEGIWRYDVEKGTYEFLTPLLFGLNETGRDAALGAYYDRIVVEGGAYLEYDLATMRLLRRYQGLGQWGGWFFQGSIVTHEMAHSLGISSGVYGFPLCSPMGDVVAICPSMQPPGYDQPTSGKTRFDLLERRSLDPSDESLTLFARLEEPMKHIALDTKRHAFWFRYTTVLQEGLWSERLTRVPLVGGGLGSMEVVKDETWRSGETEPFHTESLVYDPLMDALLSASENPSLPPAQRAKLRVIPLDGSPAFDLTPQPEQLPSSMTRIPAEPPARYLQIVPAIGKARGANRTSWRSDLWIYNPADENVTFTMRRVAAPGRSRDVTLAPHASVAIDDVLGSLGGGSADQGGDGTTTDALVIDAPYEWSAQLAVQSRTWTPAADGGSYGQSIPAVPSENGYANHLSSPSDVGFPGPMVTEPKFVIDERDPGRFRHNIGAVNDGDDPVHLGFESFHCPFECPLNEVVVPPHSVINFNAEQMFTPDSGAPPLYQLLVFGDHSIPVWISVVDNRTGDASFVPYTLFEIQPDRVTTMAIPAVGETKGANGTRWRTDLYGTFLEPDPPDDPTRETGSPLAWFYPASGGPCQAGTTDSSGLMREIIPREGSQPLLLDIYSDVVGQFPNCAGQDVRGALEVRVGAWTAGYARTYT
ncbi:MAG: hypothetical protein WBX15_06415, partial [Thermoanaerobaculia bacterium]